MSSASVPCDVCGSLINHIPVGVQVWQMEQAGWRLIFANQAAAGLMQVPLASSLGRPMADLFPGLCAQGVPGLLTEILDRHASKGLGLFHMGAPGSAPLAAMAHGFALADRRVGLTLEPRSADDPIWDTRASYRRLVEMANDGIWLIDSDGRTQYASERMAQMLGYTVEELHGRSAYDFMDESVRGQSERNWARMKQGISGKTDRRLRRKDGSTFWAIISSKPIFSDTGEFLGGLAMVTDITERKQAEARIGFLANILSQLNDATIAADGERRITYWNAGAERLFELRSEAAVGRRVEDVLAGAWLAPAQQAAAYEALATTGAWRGETTYARRTGEEAFIELSVSVLKSDNGSGDGLLAVIRDITPTKRALNALRHANDDLEMRVQERTAELSRTNRALHRNREELRALTARLLTAQDDERRRISRELHDDTNQKLAMLTVETEHLEQQLSPAQGGVRERLRALGRGMVALSEDLRQIAHHLHPSILDDLGLAIALRYHIRDFASREGMTVKFIERHLPGCVPTPIASCLYRVTQESLRNVAKHAGPTAVTVTLTGSREAICLSVNDAGVGFLPADLKGKPGLGIISMRERVRLVGGRISVTSRRDRGTRVRVEIPLAGKAV